MVSVAPCLALQAANKEWQEDFVEHRGDQSVISLLFTTRDMKPFTTKSKNVFSSYPCPPSLDKLCWVQFKKQAKSS